MYWGACPRKVEAAGGVDEAVRRSPNHLSSMKTGKGLEPLD
jgi:hypothetical protein